MGILECFDWTPIYVAFESESKTALKNVWHLMKNEKDFQYSCLQFMMCDPNICMYMRYDRILYVIQYFFFLYSTTKKKSIEVCYFWRKGELIRGGYFFEHQTTQTWKSSALFACVVYCCRQYFDSILVQQISSRKARMLRIRHPVSEQNEISSCVMKWRGRLSSFSVYFLIFLFFLMSFSFVFCCFIYDFFNFIFCFFFFFFCFLA